MKKIIVLLSLILIVGCKSKTVVNEPDKSKMTKITLSDVEVNQKNKTYELGKRILMTCNTSKFKPFTTSEATESVIRNTTQERLTKTCLKFRLRYGNFIDLKLIEVYRNEQDDVTIFRYKALYQKEIANKELQIFLNHKNQISAIKSLDWVDSFN